MKQWVEVADFVGFPLDAAQIHLLGRYRDWLGDEAIPAGGLGSAEAGRLDRRHIADSLLFAAPVDSPPTAIIDLGTGVGLPGIPLAVLFPHTRVSLIDRSQRRLDLARRAVRVLGLDNIEVFQTDLTTVDGAYPMVVSRASLPPDQLAGTVKSLLSTGGVAVLGGSWIARPETTVWEIHEIPAEILDRTVWLLIMRRQ